MNMQVIGMLLFSISTFETNAGAATKSSSDTLPLVDVNSVSSGIHHDIRYATANNFTGKRVQGYNAAKCLLHAPAAEALAAVEQGLRSRGFALIIFDCYRPTIAVADFMHWAADASDQSTKAAYYPNLDKSSLVPDYIAEKSGHSKGATVDVGLLDCRSGVCVSADMGTSYDFFGPEANTEFARLSKVQKEYRQMLVQAMAGRGFVNYPMEWWHFTWKAGNLPDTAYDFPIE
jgi:D-alanyl-D-alanine dipeptidase